MLRNVCRPGLFFLIFAIVCASAPGGLCGPRENMISDPGFEIPRGESAWVENNWDHCVAEFERTGDNPHTGKFCQRVTIRELTGRDIQFIYPALPIGPGSMVKLGFWIRGPESARYLNPIAVHFRKRGAPYTAYFSAHMELTPGWRKHSYNVTLPDNTDPDDPCLMFVLAEETSFFLDDVSVSLLPDKEPGSSLEGNQVANGSFEVGRDRWYATFRESGGYVNAPIATERNIDADLEAIDVPDAPDGKRVLRFEVFPQCSAAVTSAYFPLRYGLPATLGFRMKTSPEGSPLNARIGHGIFPNIVWLERRCTNPDTDWHFHTFTFTPSPSTSGTYFIEFSTASPGIYEIDAVTVNEGTEPVAAVTPEQPVVGWESADGDHPANIFSPGEAVAFDILVQTRPGVESAKLNGHVVDVWDRVVVDVELTVPISDDGFGRETVTLPSNRTGSFKCELYLAETREGVPAVEIVYHVPPDLPPLESVEDSFFGGHFRLIPHDLHIAERGGFRWLRLHPPLCTKWVVVEPEPGRFEFFTDGVKRAKTMGFRILGTFGSVPEFHSSAPEGMATGSVFNNFAPKDWRAWEEYCSRAMRTFEPYIDHWENWNEPDGGFLRVGPDQDRLDLVLKLSEHTEIAARGTDPDAILLGGAVATLRRPLLSDALDAGVGKYCDVISFHLYGPTPDRHLLQKIESLFGHPGRDGEEMEVWHSEGGLWLSDGGTWLKTTGFSSLGGTSVTDVAANLAQTMALLKAIGVRKHFHYTGCGHQAGRIVYRNGFQNLIDINGIPHAVFGAHAAAVLFLEGATGRGFEEQDVGEATVRVARFERDGENTTVVWSDRPVPLTQLPEFDPGVVRVFDMMGNRIDDPENVSISATPVYLIRNSGQPVKGD